MTSQCETNLWSTHVNIVRLAEPIRRCVRWRTQIFKIEGFFCKRFLPFFLPLSLPGLSFFGSRFISRAVKTKNPLPRSFLAPKLNRNACYVGYDIHTLPICSRWAIELKYVPSDEMVADILTKPLAKERENSPWTRNENCQISIVGKW